MQTNEFYELVQQRSHLDTADRAREASEAVVGTLGETLTAGEARDVGAQLPDDLAGVIERADHDGAGYDREAFVERISDRLRGSELEPDDAERYADAVTDAVTESITQGELEDLKAQLDAELDPFFEGVDVDRDDV